jgi:DNA (cytosine-5)-methyltransferase 1
LDWGPLDNNGKPIKSKKGHSFNRWLGKLKAQGYKVEWRKLVAADYGAPTTRKRLFLIARRDGQPIVWPEPTHGAGCERPWRAAAEVIDWQVPTKSIFDRRKPLAPATLRRIAAGIIRFVIQNPRPFLVKFHGGDDNQMLRNHGLEEPLRTIDTANRFAMVDVSMASPVIVPLTHTKSGDRAHDGAEPLRTITTARGGELAVVAPTFAPATAAHVTKFHEGSVGASAEAPLPTVTANSPHGRPGGAVPLGVVEAKLSPVILNNMSNNIPRSVSEPLATLCTGNHKYVISPQLTRLRGATPDSTAPTNTASVGHGVVSPVLVSHYGNSVGREATQPAPTITAGGQGHTAIASVALEVAKKPQARGSKKTAEAAPFGTVDRREQVREFLETYCKQKAAEAQADAELSLSAASERKKKRNRKATTPLEIPPFVSVEGIAYVIVDIGMRMLRPHELWKAQGFPENVNVDGFNQAEQIELCGNSVSPPVAEALVRANYSAVTPVIRSKSRIGQQLELL